MAWSDVKTELATMLEGLDGIKRAYTDPPGTLQDVPCFIIYPPAIELQRRMSGWRLKLYTLRLRCLVLDADLATAASRLDTFREIMIDAMDGELTLGTHGHVLAQRIEEAGAFLYGDKTFSGFDCLIEIRLDDSVTYA